MDLAFSDDGDLVIDESGDLALRMGVDCLRDDINIRIITNAPEWQLDPWLGATLDDLIGEPNTQQTGLVGEAKIIGALTADNKVSRERLTVHTIPINANEIIYHVTVKASKDDISMSYVVSLDS
jgi:hypothetical protein